MGDESFMMWEWFFILWGVRFGAYQKLDEFREYVNLLDRVLLLVDAVAHNDEWIFQQDNVPV